MKRTAGACLVASVTIVSALVALDAAHGQPPLVPHYKCYDVQTYSVSVPPVTLVTQFGTVEDVTIGPPTRVCMSAVKNGEGDLFQQDLECFAISGQPPDRIVSLLTQFGMHENVSVGVPQELCVPVTLVEPQPTDATPETPDPPPLVPHYECFEIAAAPPQVPPVNLETQFGVEQGVPVGPATRLCLPALKSGEGSLDVPHLECFAIDGLPLGYTWFTLLTQFGMQGMQGWGTEFGAPSELCIPALKQVVTPTPTSTPYKVGGIAELDASSLEKTGSSGSSGSTYAGVGGIVAGVMLLGAAGWYARRRLSS